MKCRNVLGDTAEKQENKFTEFAKVHLTWSVFSTVLQNAVNANASLFICSTDNLAVAGYKHLDN